MKFPEKYEIVRKVESNYDDILKQELLEYDFEGDVDFCSTPTCTFDVENNIIVPFYEKGDPEDASSYLYIDDKLVKAGLNVKFLQVGTFRLKRNYHLQDFFDKNKDAKCIVFYRHPDSLGSVFHPGNQIRAAVITKDGEQSEESKPGMEQYK